MHTTTMCQAKSNIFSKEMVTIYTIYRYTNIHNGKVYIGQTSKSLEERAQTNGRNYRECRRFYAAIQKYSWDAFKPDVLEIVDSVEDANEREIYYINLYNSTDEKYGYNLLLGGDNKEMSSETKELISIKAKERYADKTANPMYGKKHSPVALERQSICKRGEKNPMYGSKWTEVQKERCGVRGKKLNLSTERRQELSERMRILGQTVGLRPVRCVEDGVVYESVSTAANAYGVTKSTMCGHLTGHQKSCKGKHFEYIDLEGATTNERHDQVS